VQLLLGLYQLLQQVLALLQRGGRDFVVQHTWWRLLAMLRSAALHWLGSWLRCGMGSLQQQGQQGLND
jgi:hypothetical protein